MRTMCIFVSLLPLEVQSNLSISEAMFGIPTPPIRLRLRRFRTYNMKNKDVQACHLLLSVNFRPPPNPILIRSTNRKNYFLITYQTGDCRHGDNDTDHYYRCYPQASPVSWTVQVDMIVVMSCRLISVVYHGFIHG